MGISKSHDKMYFIWVHISYPSPYDAFHIAISHWDGLIEGEKRQALYFLFRQAPATIRNILIREVGKEMCL